jgi:hypothetical protein
MPVTLRADALTTVERVKEQGSGIASSDPTQDEQIKFLINSATGRFKAYAQREFTTLSPQTTGAGGAMTAGSAILTDTNANFQAGDVGKVIVVYGAGVLGVYAALETTILSRTSATQVTLSQNAANTVSGAAYTYGNATRTFELQSDGYGGAFVNLAPGDAQAVGAVTLDTQGGATGTLLSASTPDYQGVWQNYETGAYSGIDIYSTASTSYSTITPVGVRRLVTVSGVWGWPTPALYEIEHACVEQVKAWLKESQVMRTMNYDASATSAIEVRGALLGWVMRELDMHKRYVVAV